MGVRTVWAKVRQILFWWWIWGVAATIALIYDKWAWAAGMGVTALFTFLAWPREVPPRVGLDHEFCVDDDEFLTTMAGATGVPFYQGNAIEILHNGDSFYPAMLKSIGHAEYSVTVEAYIYWAGEIGRTFAKALAAKAESGVSVKILLDAVGSSTIGDEILEILEKGKCQLAWYNPVRLYNLGRFNHRTHRKSLIVDGRIAYTGGAGIADHWMGNAQDKDHWRDTQIRLEGPAVVPLQTGFAHNWLQTTEELISGFEFYPAIEKAAGPLAVQTILSSPETGASTARTFYYLSIAAARRTIFIANPYFIPDQGAIDLLLAAKKRGVDVRIMVAGIYNDNWMARQNSVRLYGPMLKAGIEILEYNHTMLHQKTMVVDGVWATVGTTNFDSRSFAHNEENNVCFCDRRLARQLEEVFRNDVKGCDVITLKSWRKRPLLAKSVQAVVSLLQEQV
ncbi:MAG TPA: phospholipase D-like domain-containing protein [Vicinamibacterales bacterium]|nr:phospholipase D-like domain-containing protein [Vicinamibacterales bacterium]